MLWKWSLVREIVQLYYTVEMLQWESALTLRGLVLSSSLASPSGQQFSHTRISTTVWIKITSTILFSTLLLLRWRKDLLHYLIIVQLEKFNACFNVEID
jgi:hypothetical protein